MMTRIPEDRPLLMHAATDVLVTAAIDYADRYADYYAALNEDAEARVFAGDALSSAARRLREAVAKYKATEDLIEERMTADVRNQPAE